MARRSASSRWNILACLALAASSALAQETYYFTGAVTVQGGGGGQYSPAQQAQCPQGYDNRCDSIGASDYCCPSGNSCSWSNSQVMCCPYGQTCTGYSSGDGAYQPSSYYAPPETSTVYYQPTSQYVPPATTVYAAGGGSYQESQPAQGYGGYCSTYYAEGPNLPTTRQGECGTVLVIEPGEGMRWAMGWGRLLVMLGALHAVGGVLFYWR